MRKVKRKDRRCPKKTAGIFVSSGGKATPRRFYHSNAREEKR